MLISFVDIWDASFRAWAAGMGWPLEGMFRLLLAAIAGGLVGLEREVRGRQAGFRTNMLVCVGSTLAMVVSTQFASFPWQAGSGVNVNVDPARIAYSVMTGVGFLGAGAIIQSKEGIIRGLTTAAAIWCVAAVGLALGFGLYLLAAVATAMVVLALWFLDYFEDMLPRQKFRTITVRTAYHPLCLPETIKQFERAGIQVLDSTFDRKHDLSEVDIHLHVMFVRSEQYFALEASLAGEDRYRIIALRET